MNPLFQAIDRLYAGAEKSQAQQAQQALSAREKARHELRLAAFHEAGAELYLERHSDDTSQVRLNIGHMSFGIGQPRNGTEAASVLRTFRDALTDLLMAAREYDCQRYCSCPAPEECRLKQCECAQIDAADRRFPKE